MHRASKSASLQRGTGLVSPRIAGPSLRPQHGGAWWERGKSILLATSSGHGPGSHPTLQNAPCPLPLPVWATVPKGHPETDLSAEAAENRQRGTACSRHSGSGKSCLHRDECKGPDSPLSGCPVSTVAGRRASTGVRSPTPLNVSGSIHPSRPFPAAPSALRLCPFPRPGPSHALLQRAPMS